MRKFLLMCLMMLGMGLSAQITLGNGTSTSYFPVYPYYGYTYTQQIFPKTEINANAAGNITGLKFYCGTSTSLTNSDNWTVYLGTTSKTSFTSDSDWVSAGSLTPVFSGTVTNNAGVVEVTFTTPFSYDNVNNLVVAVDENKPDYNTGSSGNFYSYTSTSNSSIYYASDSNNPDPFAPPAGSRIAKKSNMTIVGLTQSLLPACPVVSAPSNGATDVNNLPVINWSATPNATGYRLTMGTTPGGTDVMNNVDLGNVTSYTFTSSLLYGKQYYYTLNAYSASGSSAGCSQLSFTTKNIGCPTITAPISNATGISSTPTIEWSAVTDATGYRISVGTTAGGTDVLNNSDIGNVTAYTFSTPLAGGTKYYYTVNSYTANNISASCVEKSFTTACSNAITTLPWTENFDGLTTIGSGIVPTCWSTTVGTSNWSSMNTSSVSYNAPKSTPNYMTIPYGNTAASQLWTPGFNLTAGTTYEFSFYYNTNGTTSSYVGFSGDVLVNNSTNAGTATSLGTFITSTQGTGSYTLYKVFYTPTTTNNYYFAVNVSSNGSPWYLGVDDFKLQVAPTCLEPTNIVSANATTTTVDVSWTAPGTAPANGYDLYYSTNNTAPISTTNPNYTAIAGTSKTVSGLASGSSYYIWVRSRCSGTDQSAWTGPLLISTAITNDDCANPVALTLGGDFAANVITSTNIGATTDGTPMACQTNAVNNVWYSVVVPASGSLTVETRGVTGSTYTDSIINVFSGSCGSLTEILCDDDAGNDNFSKVTLTGQTPGATLLVSVWRYGAGTGANGQFQISAYDASILATNETSNAKNKIKVYPNPFADVLNISEINNVKGVLVTDISGRLVKTIANPVSSLYLGELKSGMYLVTLTMKDGTNQTIKVIKK